MLGVQINLAALGNQAEQQQQKFNTHNKHKASCKRYIPRDISNSDKNLVLGIFNSLGIGELIKVFGIVVVNTAERVSTVCIA